MADLFRKVDKMIDKLYKNSSSTEKKKGYPQEESANNTVRAVDGEEYQVVHNHCFAPDADIRATVDGVEILTMKEGFHVAITFWHILMPGGTELHVGYDITTDIDEYNQKYGAKSGLTFEEYVEQLGLQTSDIVVTVPPYVCHYTYVEEFEDQHYIEYYFVMSKSF